jgi:hypothetical protein
VIFPAQRLTIRFNHEKHVKALKLPCASCHDGALTSDHSSDVLLPAGARCDACHGTDHRDLENVRNPEQGLLGQCGYCHLGYESDEGQRVRRQVIPKPNLRFSHAVHASRNIGCGQCHGEVQNIELATRDQLPRMKGCFTCHQMPEPARGDASSECVTCHLETPSGRMRSKFAEGYLEPPAWMKGAHHDSDFIERHKFVAANHPELCTSCHSEKFCTDCHDGNVRPRRVHPGDFISMHAVQARQDQPRCSSCHRAQSFCASCHQRSGITMSGPYANAAGRGRFHPAKTTWTDGPVTSMHHAWEARRNMNACVSCHNERDCAICHATQERGGAGAGLSAGGASPHAPGFALSCGRALRRNARPCLVCHDPQDPKLGRCR